MIKNWEYNQIYNFSEEFNRLEEMIKYCDDNLTGYYYSLYKKTDKLETKTDWKYSDIPFLPDYNRIKKNINELNKYLGNTKLLSINETEYNQKFTNAEANELERNVKANLDSIGNLQVSHSITGLGICGSNDIRLDGANKWQ